MKNRTVSGLLVNILILVCSIAYASPVDSLTALRVASKQVQFRSTSPAEFLTQVPWEEIFSALAYSNNEENNLPAFYIFNHPQGFVIVAGDDMLPPVLAYSDEGNFHTDNIADGLRDCLTSYIDQLNLIKTQQFNVQPSTQRMWNEQLNAQYPPQRNHQAVAPLLQTTWGQGANYNLFCPIDNEASSGHAVAGCVAVAMAQIIKYWQFPFNGYGNHSYTHASYGFLSADFYNTTYLYNLMPNVLSNNSATNLKQAVAKLIYHCGVAVEMDYGPSSSSAYPIGNAPSALHAMRTYFGYSEATSIRRNLMPNDQMWRDSIKHQLDLGRPVLYTGYGDRGGHSFVCDGYDDNNYFHFNWGWGGSNDGYFLLTDLTPGTHSYSNNQNAIINLYPTMIPGINVNPNQLEMSASANIDSLQIEGLLLHSAITVSSQHPFLLSTDKLTWFTQRNIDTNGGTVYVKYFNSGHLSDSATIVISAVNVSSKFVPIKGYSTVDTIFASASGGGVIEPEGVLLVPRHSNMEFYLHSIDSDYVFVSLTVDGQVFHNPIETYTFNNIICNHHIHLTYRMLDPEIIVNTDASKAKLYPNPVHNNVTVMLPESWSDATLNLYDINGRLLQKQPIQNEERFNLSNLSSGSYIIMIENDGAKFTQKIIKY